MTVHPNDDVAHNILNEQRGGPVDTDPLMPCAECGEEYRWEHFKNHGKVPADPEKPILCAACNGGFRVKPVEKRREENRQITAY